MARRLSPFHNQWTVVLAVVVGAFTPFWWPGNFWTIGHWPTHCRAPVLHVWSCATR